MNKKIAKRLNNANRGKLELNPLEMELLKALKTARSLCIQAADGESGRKMIREIDDAISMAEEIGS